jgi:uncharacterized protein HemX
MKIVLFLIVTAAALGGGVWGYAAWQNHRSAAAEAAQDQLGEQAAQNALTPYKNTGPKMTNPFPAIKINP